MRWVRGDACVCGGGGGRRKKKGRGVHGWWGNKKEKRNEEWGLGVWWEKRGSGYEGRRKI